MLAEYKKPLLWLGFVCVLLALATWYFIAGRSPSVDESTLNVLVPEASVAEYTDINGLPVSLREYLGKVIVVSSWASWAPQSAADLNLLEELAKEYNGQVVSLGINRKETKEQALRYLNAMQLNLEETKLILDSKDYFYGTIAGYAMPEVVVYGKAGELLLHDRGEANRERIKEAINKALE
jgi:thiol-disulfide isomerase/thioredoxin